MPREQRAASGKNGAGKQVRVRSWWCTPRAPPRTCKGRCRWLPHSRSPKHRPAMPTRPRVSSRCLPARKLNIYRPRSIGGMKHVVGNLVRGRIALRHRRGARRLHALRRSRCRGNARHRGVRAVRRQGIRPGAEQGRIRVSDGGIGKDSTDFRGDIHRFNRLVGAIAAASIIRTSNDV